MKTRLTFTLIAIVGLMVLVALVRTRSEAAVVTDNHTNKDYKGGSTFNLVSAGPNVARCGPAPDNLELSFTGSGIDTEGGYNTAVFSACTNTTTGLIFGLQAVDTYLTGDQVFIEGDPFVQTVNPANCVATNADPVPFRVTGGTGIYAGATGHGKFHITSNLTPCNGLTPPAQVWFKGKLKRHP